VLESDHPFGQTWHLVGERGAQSPNALAKVRAALLVVKVRSECGEEVRLRHAVVGWRAR
jgi:hypothetical protein